MKMQVATLYQRGFCSVCVCVCVGGGRGGVNKSMLHNINFY